MCGGWGQAQESAWAYAHSLVDMKKERGAGQLERWSQDLEMEEFNMIENLF